MYQTELCQATRDLREAAYKVQNLARSDAERKNLGVQEQEDLWRQLEAIKERVTAVHHLAHTGCKHE